MMMPCEAKRWRLEKDEEVTGSGKATSVWSAYWWSCLCLTRMIIAMKITPTWWWSRHHLWRWASVSVNMISVQSFTSLKNVRYSCLQEPFLLTAKTERNLCGAVCWFPQHLTFSTWHYMTWYQHKGAAPQGHGYGHNSWHEGLLTLSEADDLLCLQLSPATRRAAGPYTQVKRPIVFPVRKSDKGECADVRRWSK